MANRKLKSLKFPGIDDTYILDAGNVNYSDEETYEEGSVGKGLNALKEDLTENYAKNDGYYDGMTVGNAEQIVGTVFEEDDTAYNYRTTGGAVEVGDRAYVESVTGGSLVWNQFAKALASGNWDSESGVTASYADGVATISSTTSRNGIRNVANTIIQGHKYLFSCDFKSASAVNVVYKATQVASNIPIALTGDANWHNLSYMSIGSETTSASQFYIFGEGSYSNLQARNAMIFDLTAMFGATIADYIYALETAHAGDGVAWFKRYFPKPYYAYHAVGMEHVNAVSAKTVGFNQFDKDNMSPLIKGYIGNGVIVGDGNHYIRYIPCFPNTTYYGTRTRTVTNERFGLASFTDVPAVGSAYTSQNTAVYSGTVGEPIYATLTTGPNDRYLAVWYAWSSSDVEQALDTLNIHIRWDNSRDGDYEPYNLHTYPLADITLRGVPLIDESGNLKFDGDRYLADGTVERRYVEVDLGTLTWVKKQGAEGCFGAVLSVQYKYANNLNITCEKWQKDSVVANVDNGYYPSTDKLFRYYYQSYSTTPAAEFYVKDTAYDSMSATEFKTAMNGVKLVYELATPTTEEADPYQYPMVVDNWGTEEFVDGLVESGDRDVAIPVGHETKYPPNLKDKLESAANNPDSDGEYLLKHDGGSNTYIPLSSNATIQNIISRLEALEGGGENE